MRTKIAALSLALIGMLTIVSCTKEKTGGTFTPPQRRRLLRRVRGHGLTEQE